MTDPQSPIAAARPRSSAIIRAAIISGLICGALDITAAVLQNLRYPAQTIFQSVASGWLGAAAYEGGWPTAWLGLASHFGIMLGIAAIFMMLAALRPSGRARWILAGAAWGVIVWIIMTFAVVPLSASPLPPPDLVHALKGVATHIVCVGWPMAWIARRMLGPAS